MRHLASWLLDSGPVLILALIAGAGSFTHTRDTATEHGQTGPMAWAVAVCVRPDLRHGRPGTATRQENRTPAERHGRFSWPTLVLVGGVVLSLAANLAQAEPSPWGWITAATPAGAFLIAVSMLERRASRPEPSPALAATSETVPEPAAIPLPAPTEQDGPATELLTYARRVREHPRRLIAECFRLGALDDLADLRLAEWAHMLGFRGHFSTKSRHYSATFGKMRAERVDHRRDEAVSTGRLPLFDEDTVLVIAHWAYAGKGLSAGDAVLAAALTGTAPAAGDGVNTWPSSC